MIAAAQLCQVSLCRRFELIAIHIIHDLTSRNKYPGSAGPVLVVVRRYTPIDFKSGRYFLHAKLGNLALNSVDLALD
jgi:hypothetical protein